MGLLLVALRFSVSGRHGDLSSYCYHRRRGGNHSGCKSAAVADTGADVEVDGRADTGSVEPASAEVAATTAPAVADIAPGADSSPAVDCK